MAAGSGARVWVVRRIAPAVGGGLACRARARVAVARASGHIIGKSMNILLPCFSLMVIPFMIMIYAACRKGFKSYQAGVEPLRGYAVVCALCPEGVVMRMKEADATSLRISLYKRRLATGRVVYYYQFYGEDGKRSCGKATGKATKTAAALPLVALRSSVLPGLKRGSLPRRGGGGCRLSRSSRGGGGWRKRAHI
jgi:hypothetical protein